MKRTLAAIIITATTVAVAAIPSQAAAQQFSVAGADAALVTLPGGRIAVIEAEAGVVVVGSLLGEASAGSTAIDIAIGDRVVSIQQANNPTVEVVKTEYDKVAVGAEVVLGLVRGGAATRLIRFPKPAGTERQMAVSMAGGGTGAWTSGGGASDVTEVVIAGAHVRNNGEGMPEVTHRTSHPAGATVSLRAGDVIVAFNGRQIAALAGLDMLYRESAVGAQVALGVVREGSRIEVSFAKPKE